MTLENNNINIIDCTLRDGGYYNNWDFPKNLVEDYIKSIASVGIKNIELGFRSLRSKDFKGPCWYTTDSYLENLKINRKIHIGVMVNVSEILPGKISLRKKIFKLFKNSKKSKVKFVRLATHLEEIDYCIEACKILKKLGYKTCINLMQISEHSENSILNICKKINTVKPDVFYFADSLGSLMPNQIENIIKIIRKVWKGQIGIHSHDNIGRALQNSLEGINFGINWVDATVTGMGRGPGNTQTEYLISELSNKSNKIKSIFPIIELIEKYFNKMKEKYQWGTNPYYFLSGKFGIHPTYIQEMLSLNYSRKELLAAIEQLKLSGASRYKVDLVRSEFQKTVKLKKGTWSPTNLRKKKDVFLLASGPGLTDYKDEIEKYISKNKPYVVALNTNVAINKKLINAYVACNPINLIADLNHYKNLSSPLILPKSLFSKKLINQLKNVRILDYGIGMVENTFEFYKNGSIVPRLYTLSYALAISTVFNCRKILLAGFDGYGANNKRTQEINKIFYIYNTLKNSKNLISITPTTYSIPSSSIYAFK